MWLLIVLAVIALFIFLAWLDFHMGHKADQRNSKKREYPIRHGTIDFYDDGQTFFSAYFKELRKAQSFIHVSFYITKQDDFSKEFFHILMDRAREGITVRLLIDWLGGHSLTQSMKDELKEAGVQLHFSHRPTFPYTFYSIQRRNHRKITIVDGVTGFLGGFNIGKEYISQQPNLSPWRDYHLRLRGEGIQDLYDEFAVDWKRAVGEDLSATFTKAEAGSIPYQLFPSEAGQLEAKFIDVLSNAKSSIRIGSPYFIPTPAVYKVLEDQAKKGLTIQLLVPDAADHKLVKEAAYRYFRKLYAAGQNVEVYQYQNGFYHAKALIIDNSFCDIGTANFDRRSFKLNHELNCFIYHQGVVDEVIETYSIDLSQSSNLTREKLQRMPLFTRFKEWVARSVENFL